MLELLILGAVGIGLYAFVEASRAASSIAQKLGGGTIPVNPAGPAVTPGGAPPAPLGTFPIPSTNDFVTRVLPGNFQVAAFRLDTQKMMVEALSAREWRVGSVFPSLTSPTVIMLIGAPTQATAPNLDVLSAARLAASAGQNVYFDADMAMKLAGELDSTLSASFMMFDPSVPPPDPGIANEGVATTPAEAKQAIAPGFQGSRFVLFAQAGENF